MSEKELERRIDVIRTAVEEAQFYVNYASNELKAISREMEADE